MKALVLGATEAVAAAMIRLAKSGRKSCETIVSQGILSIG